MSLCIRFSDLEELDTDAGKHEVQQHGHQDNVADGLDGHKHTLDHVLQNGSGKARTETSAGTLGTQHGQKDNESYGHN